MPVYDKPLIYYPLSTLMLAGIREILIISTPRDTPMIQGLLGDGTDWGIHLTYATQPEPRGIAESLIIGEQHIEGFRSALILGDNIFHGPNLGVSLQRYAIGNRAAVLAYEVNDPRAYAVISFSDDGSPVSIEEKPASPCSNFAVPGLYFYPDGVSALAKALSPSARGELEITDINHAFLSNGTLDVVQLPRGTAWLDAGTVEDLADAAQYVRVLEERQGVKLGCPEEVAWRQGWIDSDHLNSLGKRMLASTYGRYLCRLAMALPAVAAPED